MEPLELILLSVVVGLIVGAIAWFGPRRRQWRSHDLEPTEAAKPLSPQADTTREDDADERMQGEP